MGAEQVGIGVIGAGRIGRVHAKNLSQRVAGAKLLAVADVNKAAAEEASALWGGYAASDYRRLLDDSNIDAILICSATDTHAPIIMEAAAAGKHIFCEKPIALALDKIDKALEAVDQAGVKLQIGFNRRFDSNHVRVRQAIVAGEIGDPHLFHIISRDPAPPPLSYIQVSGGIFLDMTIHDFDMARFLMGCEATEVYAVGGVRVDEAIGAAGDIDTALTTLKFTNGALGVIDNSRRAVYGYDQRVEVFGSKGSIATSNNYANNAVLSTNSSISRELPLNFFMERYTESYVAEISAFVKAIVEDTEVPVTGADGRAPVVLGMAARCSYDEGRPIKLDEFSAITAAAH